jgi:hypothetical protein
MAGEQHQLEAVVDLVDAVFNGYTGHEAPLSFLDFREIFGAHTAKPLEKQAFALPPAGARTNVRDDMTSRYQIFLSWAMGRLER